MICKHAVSAIYGMYSALCITEPLNGQPDILRVYTGRVKITNCAHAYHVGDYADSNAPTNILQQAYFTSGFCSNPP